jgi:hypothetical protein
MNRETKATKGRQKAFLVSRLLCRWHGRDLLGVGLTLLAIAGALRVTTNAQVPQSPVNSVLSYSGQFVIHAERSSQPPSPFSSLATNRNLVRLEPALMGVSCERIKQILLRELGSGAPWSGKIYVELRPARVANQTITITSERFKGGWQYQLKLPDQVERDRYLRAIIHALLLEYANRGRKARLAEIPLWLTEGFSQRLLASSETEIILPPPRETVNGLNVRTLRVTDRVDNPIEQARGQLRGRPPLTFDQLSWQAQDELSDPAAELYRSSAQLFLAELLHLPNGRACLATMLTRLAQYQNWQLAFLEGFRSHFERPLDVEKWWALCCVQSPKRSPAQSLSVEGGWDDLDRALGTPAPGSTDATSQSGRPEVSLQTIIREWGRAQQIQALHGKLQELGLLRARVAPDLAVLVQEYGLALEVYLQNQHRAKPVVFFGNAGRGGIAQETLQRLDALDARREALRPPKAPLAADQVTAQPVPSP